MVVGQEPTVPEVAEGVLPFLEPEIPSLLPVAAAAAENRTGIVTGLAVQVAAIAEKAAPILPVAREERRVPEEQVE